MATTNDKEKSAETDEKVTVAFRCSQELADFIKSQTGEESISTYLRSLIREKMEAGKQSEQPSFSQTGGLQ